MRILVASGLEAGSQRANAINTVKMAQGFARLGHNVTILCRQSAQGKMPHAHLAEMYGLMESIRWVQLPQHVLMVHVDRRWLFAPIVGVLCHFLKPDIVYARNLIFPWIGSKYRIPTVTECHTPTDNKTLAFMYMLSASSRSSFLFIVTISHILANHYHFRGVPQEKLLVLPDAVDLHLFTRPALLPPSPYASHGPHIAYTGHLYDVQGIPTLLETAAQLPDMQFHLVGGLPDDIVRQEQRIHHMDIHNVTLYGLKAHAAVPPFQWHADVVLLPLSLYHPNAQWASPMKLGEYLASGTPIVASDIPALRALVTADEVEFVAPDNAKAMAEGIQRVLNTPSRREQLSIHGIRKARTWSFEQRAQTILDKCISIASEKVYV
jgi:glycosyltransferase involved in cell wall biosynthesis